MKLSVSTQHMRNIAEIWTYGEQEFKVITKSGRTFKVITARNIYSGSSFKYNAMLEELVEVELAGLRQSLWISLLLSDPGGDTIESCLENGLQFINNELK